MQSGGQLLREIIAHGGRRAVNRRMPIQVGLFRTEDEIWRLPRQDGAPFRAACKSKLDEVADIATKIGFVL